MDIDYIVDLYKKRVEQRETKLNAFFEKKEKFLVMQRPAGNIWGVCNSIDQICANNLNYMKETLEFEFTDDIPFMEPWIGVGVYANALGCDYRWRENDPPHPDYLYHKIEELKGLTIPDWQTAPVINMVLDCIDALKERTNGEIPISLTDTQSPFDTATLVLDASEFFVACYTEPEIVHNLMQIITDIVIEFSKTQLERIGEHLCPRPGHIMVSKISGPGISISDDNLAISSRKINKQISFPYNQQISTAFGGLSIHSCGNWSHTMKLLDQIDNVTMIDCAVNLEQDPTPNDPAEVRDAMRGKGIITKVRTSSKLEEAISDIEKIADPAIPLIVELGFDAQNAETNYRKMNEKLEALYA